jgi:hypothetical protein
MSENVYYLNRQSRGKMEESKNQYSILRPFLDKHNGFVDVEISGARHKKYDDRFRYFRFWRRREWRWKVSEMLRRVVSWRQTDISEVRTAFIALMMESVCNTETTVSFHDNTRRYIPVSQRHHDHEIFIFSTLSQRENKAIRSCLLLSAIL